MNSYDESLDLKTIKFKSQLCHSYEHSTFVYTCSWFFTRWWLCICFFLLPPLLITHAHTKHHLLHL